MNASEPKAATELAKQCLELISRIAARGAEAHNPEHVRYALQELRQVLLERSGDDDRIFDVEISPPVDELRHLLGELAFVDGCSEEFGRRSVQ
jgi:hypothetical protein